MNILIARMMTSRYNTISNIEKLYGGFDVPSHTFLQMAKAYPEHKFYVINTNDLPDFADKPENLIDLFHPAHNYAINNGFDRIDTELSQITKPHYDGIVEYVKKQNIKFDLAIYEYGPTIPVARYAAGYISEKTKAVHKTLVSQRQTAHIFVLADELKVPVYLIVNDPRQLNHMPADVKPPVAIFTQCNGVDHSRYYTNLKDKQEIEVPLLYKEIEKFYLLKKDRVDFTNPDCIQPDFLETYKKDNEFIMTLNSGTDAFRFKYLQKWIFPYRPNEIIYGRWTQGTIATEIENAGLQKNFVMRGMSEMEDVMWRSRYTFVVPATKKNGNNFLTQKVYSMLYYGIIPFWSKTDYDTDYLYSDLPDYLRVETPAELWAKVDELNNNDMLYRELLKKLYDALLPKYFSLDFVHEVYDCILKK